VYSSGFSLSPSRKIFSPDGDGYEDILNLEYGGPAGAVLTIQVYDGKGRLVRDLVNTRAGLPGEPYTWDGKDNSGKTVPMGLYIIFAEQTVNDNRYVKKFGVVAARKLK
jgi:flagellar hook assembly protein FlgD